MLPKSLFLLAGTTRLELATSDVTGRRSNQLNYAPEENSVFTIGKWPMAFKADCSMSLVSPLAVSNKLLANREWLKAIPVVGGTGFEPATPGL